jgi:hypothetical protein
VNTKFRDSYAAFEARWLSFFSAYAEWVPRAAATRFDWGARYDDFVKSYERWVAKYNARKLQHETLPPAVTPAVRDLGDDIKAMVGYVEKAGKAAAGIVADALEPIGGAFAGAGFALLAGLAIAGIVLWKR